MKRIDKIYALDLIINNHKRKEYDYDLIQKLIDTDYLDWFSWFDEEAGRHKHKINATQKGMLYYTENIKKRKSKLTYLFFIVVMLVPLIILLSQSI